MRNTQLLLWRLLQFFPIVVLLAIVGVAFEIFNYPDGLWEKIPHLGLICFWMYVFFIWMITTLQVFQKNSLYSPSVKIFINLNHYLFPLLTIFYLYLQFLLHIRSSVYILDKFHIHLHNYQYLLFISICILLIEFAPQIRLPQIKSAQKAVIIPRSMIFKILGISIVLSLLGFYFIDNIAFSLTKGTQSNLFILSHLDANYDQKMAYSWKGIYFYSLFIKNNTPEDAIIVIPPQEYPWASTGNGGIMKYFLYPRKVINGGYDTLPDEKYDYVLIAKGETPGLEIDRYGWPKVDIQAESILLYSLQDLSTIPVDGDYDADDSAFKQAWGLIKVKK